MKPHKPRTLNLPHQMQARISDTQLLFIQTMAPNERNTAAQLRKTLERCIDLALETGTCSPAFYNHLARYRPTRWEQAYIRSPIPGADYLPEPHYSRVNGNRRPDQLAPQHNPEPPNPCPDPYADWEDVAPQQQHTPSQPPPVHHQPAQVIPAQPQPNNIITDAGYRALGVQPPRQPGTAQPYTANQYAHLPNSQRPPKYQATRQTRHATPDELAAEGRRVMDYAALEAQGKAPEWAHAPWEEVIPDDQV